MAWRDRIAFDPAVMGGKACVRGTRVTVSAMLGLLAAGHTESEVLSSYPYLSQEDLKAVLSYAAWCTGERDLPPPPE